MKTLEEIEKLANKEYPVKRGGPMWMQNTDDNKRYYKQEGYIEGYTQCQEDMADKKLDIDDINEMALDFIINTGGLPKTIEEWQNALWKFYQLTKQTKLI